MRPARVDLDSTRLYGKKAQQRWGSFASALKKDSSLLLINMNAIAEKISPLLFSSEQAQRALELAQQTLQIEAEALLTLKSRLSKDPDKSCFTRAVGLLLQCKGRAVVSGIGKSGHIGRKIAATLASTGTPALFVHAAEAAHGDLGMVTKNDIFIALSHSGETQEILSIVATVKRMGTILISITGNPDSSLAQIANVHLDTSVTKEACPLNLAPTASTTAALAMGDALAVALLDARGFGEEDFARSHPGGALGRRLLTYVRDVMRSGEAIPKVHINVNLPAVLLEMTNKGMAMSAVVEEGDQLQGIFTDGDLRRLIQGGGDFTKQKITDVMHVNPRTIGPDHLAVEAVQIMEEFRINQLLVVDAQNRLVGALHIHDLTRAKVI